MAELKPCPFCGGKIKIHIGIGMLRFFTCDKCGAVVSFNSDFCNKHPHEAENAWNRRAHETD
jgi:Lar family restriction alleviation protein